MSIPSPTSSPCCASCSCRSSSRCSSTARTTRSRSCSSRSPPRPTGLTARSPVAREPSPTLGKAIDPLVDRLLIASAVVGLYLEDRLPLWIVLVLLARDLYLLGGAWVLARAEHKRIQVAYIGKLTTALLLVGFGGLLLNWPVVPGLGIVDSPALPGLGGAPAALGIWFVYAGVVTSIATAVVYTVQARKALSRGATPQRVSRGETMKAVIMAGGEGTRLRPLTSLRPKPMVPIVNQPVMEHILGLVKHHGIDEVVATLAFMPQVIQDYFGDGDEWGMGIDYAIEETPLGTAGSVKNAAKLIPDRRALHRHLRRRAHRHRPARAGRRSQGQGRSGHDRAQGGRRPAGVRRRHHRRRRPHRALPGEAHVGPGLQRPDQHRHLRDRAVGARRDSRRQRLRLLCGALPHAHGARPRDLRHRRRRLLVRRRQPGELPAGAPRHPRRHAR